MERGLGLDGKETTDWTGSGKNYFLGIGIDRYQHWECLSNAVKDINDMVKVLTAQYQFEPDHIHTLFDEHATEANIYNKIRELKRNITPEDNLLVYYSGHGHYDNDFDEGYWVPADATREAEDRYISNSNIVKRINAIDSHHTLLIVDSCFSGTLVIKKRSGLTDERFRSRRILASGRQETVADGRPGENSPFAAGILTFLKKNTEKSTNTTTLVQYVKEFVENKAKQTPVEGRIQNSADEGGEFVFHLKKDEAGLWEEVSRKDTVAAYTDYLNYYPKGLHAERAERRILQIKEDDIWKSATIKDSELAYENYLKKYSPGGKYVAEARKRLEELQARQEERKATLTELSKKDEERERIREKYQALIMEAEDLFKRKQLTQARDKYREALRYHVSGFVPTTDYIDEQINFCSNGITFLNHYEHGRDAMLKGNYRLALQYFNEALKLDDNPKVEDMISYCRQKLHGPKDQLETGGNDAVEILEPEPVYSYDNKHQARPAPPKRKSSRRSWIIGGSLGLLVVVLSYFAMDSGDVYEYPDDTSLSESQQIYSDDDTYQEQTLNTKATPPPPPATTNAQLILGSWAFDEASSDDPGADMFLSMYDDMQATYTFYPNGTVHTISPFGNTQFAYQVQNNVLSIPGDINNATILRLDDSELIFKAFFNYQGYVYPVTYTFRRMD